ncbi:MAG: RNA-directed polymerase [Campylobacterota bacterium]|nr:RNA-directed polymerase [Campylobacterota bacterium]
MREALEKIYDRFGSSQAVGIDGMTKENFEANLEQELDTIVRKISNQTYEFSYYKQKLIIKSYNKTREISLPTLRDKIVINYLHGSLYEKFQEQLEDKRTTHAMIDDIKKAKESYECFVKVDIQNFYPTINHELLLAKLQEKFKEEPYLLELITKAIKQTTIAPKMPSKQRLKYANTQGVPQGLSISATLAEIYMHDIDKKYTVNKKIKFFRFVDDILILCNKQDVQKLQKSLQRDFKKLQLSIHEFDNTSEKSTFGESKEAFEFLGYRFEDGVVSVRERSSQKMFENLNLLFAKYKNGFFKRKNHFYKKLNFKITGCIIDGKRYGWIHFFSMMDDHKLLFTLDRFIEKKCQKLDLDYGKVKRYSRAIYEIRDEKSSYIPSLRSWIGLDLDDVTADLKNDVEYY